MRVRTQCWVSLLWLAFLLVAPEGVLGQGTLLNVVTNGPRASFFNLVILSEGYTADELVRFGADAQRLADRIFSVEPFKAYRRCFNVFGIAVASSESGSDHPSKGVYRSTYFSSTYDSQGIDRLITVTADGRFQVYNMLLKHVPDYDLAIVLVNDPQYGGSGGNFPTIVSTESSSAEIAIHELGHTLGGLGDEYGDPYPNYPDTEEHNTTKETDRNKVKWRAWIDPATPVPTPATTEFDATVGLFEGAHYHETGWYRPKLTCRMRDLSAPFCEVCGEALVLAMYVYVRPILSATPAAGAGLTVTNLQTAAFTVGTLPLDEAGYQIEWLVDNQPVPGVTGAVFEPSGFDLAPGSHAITVRVVDPTDRVRTDTFSRLVDTRNWQLRVVREPVTLTARYSGGGVELSWSGAAQGFVLESAAVGAGNEALVWTARLSVNHETGATFPAGDSGELFRLRTPRSGP